MSDLVLRQADGWIEITQLVGKLTASEKSDLWKYLGTGDFGSAIALLEEKLEEEFYHLLGQAQIEAVKGLAFPDDILGELFRVWVKTAD